MKREMNDKNRRQLIIWLCVGAAIIFVLVVVLISLIGFDSGRPPENAFPVDNELVKGEEQNAEALRKLNDLFDREPVLRELPLKVEYYSDDLSSYTKYIISYTFDTNEPRGFYLVVKDYTGVPLETVLKKLAEMGMDVDGVRVLYEDFTDDSMSAKAVE